ncbi:MAG: pyridoxal phosphate-dependent aminotransferase [Firmicutes bacterium]|nr:pyridoxal phosphate-dependent aminotransferase [Bacillota bacterium]
MSGIVFANRVKDLGTEMAFEILARARTLEEQGKRIIHLEIGEPDFETPSNIVKSGVHALRMGWTHYTPAPGIPALREAVSCYAKQFKNIDCDPSQVIVTVGAKPAVYFAMLCLVNPGDEVIYPDPGYPLYENVIKLVEATPVPIALREENEFRLDVDELKSRVTPKTRVIIINSPHNPTGSVLTGEDVKAIAALIEGSRIYVVSDEMYDRIVYDRRVMSIGSIPEIRDQVIVADSLSKTYAMTGWRLGFGIVPPGMSEKMSRLSIHTYSCNAAFVQIAAIEALRGPQASVDKMVAEFRQRREAVVEGVNRIEGMSCLKPPGAFYVFPNVKKLGMRSKALAEKILDEYGVAVLGGDAFGCAGEGYIRISYANSLENIQEGLKRLERAAASILRKK